MLGNLSKAKAICTTAEWQLLYQSTHKRIEVLTESQLRAKITRARKLRDKFRDLSHAQQRKTRGKGRSRKVGRVISNANTIRKQELFAAALLRFEQRLKELHRQEQARVLATKKTASARKRGAKVTEPATGKPEATAIVTRYARKPSVVVAIAAATTTGKPLRQKAERTRAMRARGRQVNANFTKIHAHVSSRGRRNQAKRDSK